MQLSYTHCQIRDLFVAPIKITLLCSVSFRVFTDYTTRAANVIFHWASVVSCKTRVIRVNFDQGKRHFVRVSGEFELSEFELTE